MCVIKEDQMPRSRSNELLLKSVSAMVAAIEIYNKPDQNYREETFAILALNAWELLFKAKILKNRGNNLRDIYVYDRKKLKDGSSSKRKYIKRNRAGNPMTISMGKAMGKIEAQGEVLNPALRANLDALMEIRDNAIHFSNIGGNLSKALQEIGTANLKNYVQIIKEWFDYSLSQYNFYLKPLAFSRDFDTVSMVNLSLEEGNLAKYLAELHRDFEDLGGNEYAVTLELDVQLKRSALPSAVQLVLGEHPEAVPVTLTEEDIRHHYPWDYNQLTIKLSERYLDPQNPNSQKKDFYSPNILNVFDKHYIRS